MTQSKSGAAARTGARAELPAYVAVRCPLCGADDYHVRFEDRLVGVSVDPQRHYTSTSSAYGEHGRIVECRSCDLVYMNPRPHHQSVQDNYSAVEDTRYLDEEQGRVETFTESLEHVAEFMPSGRMLDVGCHVGTFLTIAEQHGFQVAGVEPSTWASEIARGRINGPVHRGAVEDAPLPEGGYDVITLWDVIEHLPDPGARPALHPRVAAARAASSPCRPWTSTRCSPACSAGAGRGTCRCTSSTSRAPRSARCCAARASRSSTSGCTRAASGSRTWPRGSTPTRRRWRGLLVSGLKRVGLGERTVGIKLGDIFTVIARKPIET